MADDSKFYERFRDAFVPRRVFWLKHRDGRIPVTDARQYEEALSDSESLLRVAGILLGPGAEGDLIAEGDRAFDKWLDEYGR
jgi:hypothetical protein